MADRHEELWLDLGRELEQTEKQVADGEAPALRGAQEFMLWMHNPLTEAFFAYLGDREGNLTVALTEYFLQGGLKPQSTGEYESAAVWRGKILLLRDLQRLTLGEIAAFYRQKREENEVTG